MRLNELLDRLKRTYTVQMMSDGSYVISNGMKSIRIDESDVYDPEDVDRFFRESGPALGDFGHVGREDLFPSMQGINVHNTRRKYPKGSLMDYDTFHPQSDEESNPLINRDQITPSRNKRDTFEPDPDHLEKPGGPSRFPPQ